MHFAPGLCAEWMTGMVILVKKVLMGGSSLVVQWLDLGFHCDRPGFNLWLGSLRSCTPWPKRKKKDVCGFFVSDACCVKAPPSVSFTQHDIMQPLLQRWQPNRFPEGYDWNPFASLAGANWWIHRNQTSPAALWEQKEGNAGKLHPA